MPYKEALKEDLVKIFNEYFQEERGNRVTSFNFNGLCMRMNQVFDENQIKENDSEDKS